MKATRVEGISELFGDDGVDGGYCPIIVEGNPTWMVRTPNGHMGSLSRHTVIENNNGTITVSPSILVSNNTEELYHGFLIDGEWTP